MLTVLDEQSRARRYARQRRSPSERLQRIGARAVGGVACALLLASVLLVTGSLLGRLRVDTVESGSMAPVVPQGSLVLAVPEPAANLRSGQILAFRPPTPYPQVTVVHEVVAVRRVDGRTTIETKGVANSAPDPWRAPIVGPAWVVVAHVPWLGGVLRFARQGVASALVIILCGTLLVAVLRAATTRPTTRLGAE
jgi:signal peptidase I